MIHTLAHYKWYVQKLLKKILKKKNSCKVKHRSIRNIACKYACTMGRNARGERGDPSFQTTWDKRNIFFVSLQGMIR